MDPISNALSLTALAVSCTNLYLTVLRKTASVTAWVVQLTEDEDKETVLEFGHSNTGTVELLVSEVRVDLVGDAPDVLLPELASKQLPGVIKPGKILLVKTVVPGLFVQRAIRQKLAIDIEFLIFSARGESYKLQQRVLGIGGVYPKGLWSPFGLKPIKAALD
ncbi:hypothetical protein [Dyella sp. GSA-30]|uniref:hypothetical protein n=1 Tax=Dyella sp. GSA-30 TaxID=2994496 RepID=UPI002490732F|nr:hypothetical protein [Dyella sp. GSA-30]BDU22904.1 hypothetical protein DYGSA30_43610 [Dyella sp. GSA-30]